MSMFLFIGIALLGICVYGSLRVERRAFYRRNSMGIEEFSTYGESIKIKAKEGLMKAGLIGIGLAGFLCMLIGGIALTK